MVTKNYKYNDTSMLVEHFSVSEFRCKCGGTHDTVINPELPEKLERLFKALDCSAIVINSGYRCPTHSVNIGGSANDYHTKGYAADIICYDQSGNKISSKKVCCAEQDVGFGGISNIDGTYTATHVDVRTSNFWKGDEVVTSDYSVTDDFYSYYGIPKSFGNVSATSAIVARGIDVSEHQGVIDWDKVKASGKVDFVIIRAGYGKEISQVDRQFERNYSECKRLGIPCGAYWYTYAVTADEAKQEAKACMKIIAGKKFEYPIYFDVEEQSQFELGKTAVSNIIRAFMDTLESAGYWGGLYMSSYYLKNYTDDDIKVKYALWVADYSSNSPDYDGTYGMWQKSSTGTVTRIDGNVDIDECYVDYPQDMKTARLNGFSKSYTKPSNSEKNTLEQILDHVASIDNKIK